MPITQPIKHLITGVALTLSSAAVVAERPYLQPDDSWITIDGTVESVSADHFELDYGQGMITVEMDDGDRDADAYKLLVGDKVKVTGLVDDDLFEKTTIEASSVYVEKLNTHFFASAVDEEDYYTAVVTPVVISQVLVRGEVTDVNDDEFVINSNGEKLEIETDALPYDPLDDDGYQKIEKGDLVSVTGRIDYDFIEGREIVADSILTLRDNAERES